MRLLKERIDEDESNYATAGPLLKYFLGAYHDFRRELDAIEEFFAGHITRFSEADGQLTRTAAALWRETGLPGLPPVVVASTSGYFCTFAPLSIIFTPPSGADNLLVLPDLYHEFGHLLHQSSSVVLYGPRFRKALDDYKNELEAQRRRISRPLDPTLIDSISWMWSRQWAEEVACDTLAALMIGPAYGWCNLHLCLRTPEIYRASEHPADDARTHHIFRVLRRCGWKPEVDEMEDRWGQYVQLIKQRKPPSYDDEHPDQLFIAVMEDVEDATSGLPRYTPGQDTVIEQLNQAWVQFVTDPTNYTKSEKRFVKELHQKLLDVDSAHPKLDEGSDGAGEDSS